MQATTWKDKIADSSNSWLRATTSEEDGRLPEATVLYLKDSTESLERGLKARAALSCGCAASCLERMGNVNSARRLYLEAARIDEEQAIKAMGGSLREAFWLLQESHDYFVMAADAENASRVYDACVSLAKKLNPFATDESLDEVLRIKPTAQPRQAFFGLPAPQPREVSAAVDEFLRIREEQVGTAPMKAPRAPAQRRASIEKSIVS